MKYDWIDIGSLMVFPLLVEGKSLQFYGTSLVVENFLKGLIVLVTSGNHEKNSSTIRSSGRNRTNTCVMLVHCVMPCACTMPVKCHKIIMIYPQPIGRHRHPNIHINYACSHQLPP